MQEYGSGVSSKLGEYRDSSSDTPRGLHHQSDGFHGTQHQFTVISQKNYGSSKDTSENKNATYSRVGASEYEASSCQDYTRYNNQSIPSFSSPPHSPLVGLVFDPSTPNYSGMMAERNLNTERRSQNTWSVTNQEPIGTGAKKKIVKNQDKRNVYNDLTCHARYKDVTETDRQKSVDRNFMSESSTSLDFFTEGERMVSELCNIADNSYRCDSNNSKCSQKSQEEALKLASSEVLLTALDKIIIHDQIPNQIVQLAIEACTDAENIAISHHNRPCFKNIHSICAKTRSNVQKPDSAVANLHSQGIPWVIKNFIFSFVRILDGWKGVKELLSEKHDNFSRIENKYYSPNIRECFMQWQAVTKEMLTHIYKTFKCLDHGFTMEQKSFTHNYYSTNSAAPRHQNQSKFQTKSHSGTPRLVNTSPQSFNTLHSQWIQNSSQSISQNYSDVQWPTRSGLNYKKNPILPSPSSQSFYPHSDHSEVDNYGKSQYKCDSYNFRETKPRQSWTITNIPDFRALEGMCHAEQRELYATLKHKMDAELCKAPGQPLAANLPSDLLSRRDMELKAKMIPLSHVEKTLIPSIATAEMRACYMQKNNSCGDTKEEADFFATWGQMVLKEPNEFITHRTHNIQVQSNIVTIPSNISGPMQFVDTENDEFHEMSKVYMKPGSYKVPIKPTDTITPFVKSSSHECLFANSSDDLTLLNHKTQVSKTNIQSPGKSHSELWQCHATNDPEDVFGDEKKIHQHSLSCLGIGSIDSLEILSSFTSDKAWEAAKQSAPRLMDFIHEGSKSDTARLYRALGLTATEDLIDNLKQITMGIESSDVWSTTTLTSSHSTLKDVSPWYQNDLQTHIFLPTTNQNEISAEESDQSNDSKSINLDDQICLNETKNDDSKTVRLSFDQIGNYVKNESQKTTSIKTKEASSGMWYHPKKLQPLQLCIVQKFQNILTKFSAIPEATFIQHDMDIKVAPRFYEVVKYPMCLHDIDTKLKNSSYNEIDQVVQDFRKIFNNVRLYLKNFPDLAIKKKLFKVSLEFEKLLEAEFKNQTIKTQKRKETELSENKNQLQLERNASIETPTVFDKKI